MINNVVITGNLGKDPELKYSTGGMAITKFSMCFKSGKDKTGWIDVVCFNKIAETAASALHKGARVGVVGSLDSNSWTDKEGKTKSSLQLIVNTIEFIKTDGRGFGGNTQSDRNQQNNIPSDNNTNNNYGGYNPSDTLF